MKRMKEWGKRFCRVLVRKSFRRYVGGVARCNPILSERRFLDLQNGPGVKILRQASGFNFRGWLPRCSLHTSEETERHTPMNIKEPGHALFAENRVCLHPTRHMRREFKRRKEILTSWQNLIARGHSKARAAKMLRMSPVTLWRWGKSIWPATWKCGQISTFRKFNVSQAVVSRVQQLRAAGKTSVDAWRAVATEKICPPDLAAFLNQAKTIPASFIKASRWKLATIHVYIGANFSKIQSHQMA